MSKFKKESETSQSLKEKGVNDKIKDTIRDDIFKH
jgi:hypothetical protein